MGVVDGWRLWLGGSWSWGRFASRGELVGCITSWNQYFCPLTFLGREFVD
jgi:hypothetical protein